MSEKSSPVSLGATFETSVVICLLRLRLLSIHSFFHFILAEGLATQYAGASS